MSPKYYFEPSHHPLTSDHDFSLFRFTRSHFHLLACWLVVAVAVLVVSIYLNAQRKKEIIAVGASVQALDTEHKSSTSTMQADIRRTEGNLHSDISSVRSFAESKALRNTVVVSVADHAQIVRDHKG